MPTTTQAPDLTTQLSRMAVLRQRRLVDPSHRDLQRQLVGWQAERLTVTHDDLLRHQRSRPAIQFFLTQVYAGRDFRRRDDDLERLAPMAARVLPRGAINTLALVLEMNVLTRELDRRLLEGLLTLAPNLIDGSKPGDGKVTGVQELDEELYLAALRGCNDRRQRDRQIALIQIIGDELDQLVDSPMILTALRMGRTPARLAGLGEFQQLLEQGCRAFRAVGNAGQFLRLIVARETRILKRIYDESQRPFEPRPDDRTADASLLARAGGAGQSASSAVGGGSSADRR